jgi:hypothetical protein
VSPHWFRHAHASHALDRGAPIHLVQATFGHASITTTGHCLHARPNESSSHFHAPASGPGRVPQPNNWGPLQALPVQLGQDGGDLAASLAFIIAVVIAVVALGEVAQMGDKGIPPCASPLMPTRSIIQGAMICWRPPPAAAEEEFDCGAIDERGGEGFELPDHVGDFAAPACFAGTVSSIC